MQRLIALLFIAALSIGCAPRAYQTTQRGAVDHDTAWNQCTADYDHHSWKPWDRKFWLAWEDAEDRPDYMTPCLEGQGLEVVTYRKGTLSPLAEHAAYTSCIDKAKEAGASPHERNSMCVNLDTRDAFLLGLNAD